LVDPGTSWDPFVGQEQWLKLSLRILAWLNSFSWFFINWNPRNFHAQNNDLSASEAPKYSRFSLHGQACEAAHRNALVLQGNPKGYEWDMKQ
jgi:hypothetical protein